MPILYIPVGIPGCGKSSIAIGLNPDVIVSTDAIRERLGDVNDQSKNDQVFAQFHFEIHTNLVEGRSVFADATNLDQRARGRLRGIAVQISSLAQRNTLNPLGSIGLVSTHLILFCNPIQALQRNRKRDRKVPEDVMLRMLEKYERAVLDIEDEEYDYVTEVSATR